MTTTKETAQETNGSRAEEPPPKVLTDPHQPIPVYIETVIRNTLACFVAYCLTYAQLDDVIPHSQRFLIGLITTLIVTRIPTVSATFGLTLVAFYTLLAIALATITALLVAADVSRGLFVGIFGVWSLWISGFYYGKVGRVSWVFPAVLVAFVGMIGLGLQQVVSNGLTVIVSPLLLQSLLGGESGSRLNSEALQQLIATTDVPEMLERIGGDGLVERAGGVLDRLIVYVPLIQQALMNLYQLSAKEGHVTGEVLTIPIPEGVFQGRLLEMSLTDQYGLKLHMDGGIWLIKLFWTTSGVDNPLAVFQNLIIVFSWAIACISISYLLPPLRTTRFLISRLALPQTLRDVAWYLKTEASLTKDSDSKLERAEEARDERSDDSISDIVRIQERLKASTIVLADGYPALLSAFEPCWADFLGHSTWWTLKETTEEVQKLTIKVLVINELKQALKKQRQNTIALDGSYKDLCKTAKECEDAATALLTGNKVPTVHLQDDSSPQERENLLDIEDLAHAATAKINEWIDAINPHSGIILTQKQRAINVGSTLVAWVLPSVVIVARLGQLLLLPFLTVVGRYQLDMTKTMHCVKFAAGVTALVSMSVYWGTYRQHEFDTAGVELEDTMMGVDIIGVSPPASFSGWALMAYAFTTMPTTEGTVKKGVLRFMGTLVGAFSAWIISRIADDNVYGTVTLLTITTVIAVYLSVEKSDSARFGPSKDYSYFGFYWLLTQSVIIFEGLVSSSDTDKLVLNRIISNVAGISMAIALALVPFGSVRGSSPKWTLLLLQETTAGYYDFISILLSARLDEDMSTFDRTQELSQSFNKSAKALYADAEFLLEDAKRLSMFPFYKVSPELEEELAAVRVTALFLGSAMDQATRLLKEEQPDIFVAEGTEAHNVIKALRWRRRQEKQQQENKNNADPENARDGVDQPKSTGTTRGPHEELFLFTMKLIESRLETHHSRLAGNNYYEEKLLPLGPPDNEHSVTHDYEV